MTGASPCGKCQFSRVHKEVLTKGRESLSLEGWGFPDSHPAGRENALIGCGQVGSRVSFKLMRYLDEQMAVNAG